MSVSNWPTDVSCSLAYFVDCSLADGCQLLVGKLMSDAHKPTDISCFLTYLFQLLIGKMMSAACNAIFLLSGGLNFDGILKHVYPHY